MTATVKETIGTVIAALKVERMLLKWAAQLTAEERMKVTGELSQRGDDTQALLDIWHNAKEIADGERDDR